MWTGDFSATFLILGQKLEYLIHQHGQLFLVLFSHRLSAQIVQLRLVGKHRTPSDEAGILRPSIYTKLQLSILTVVNNRSKH
jgi:hypothetical protein